MEPIRKVTSSYEMERSHKSFIENNGSCKRSLIGSTRGGSLFTKHVFPHSHLHSPSIHTWNVIHIQPPRQRVEAGRLRYYVLLRSLFICWNYVEKDDVAVYLQTKKKVDETCNKKGRGKKKQQLVLLYFSNACILRRKDQGQL